MAIRKELPFAWYEVDAVEAWLDEQVQQGLRLTGVKSIFGKQCIFEENTDGPTRYRVHIKPKDGYYTRQEEYKETMRELGWEYVDQLNYRADIYRAARPDAVEINTDEEALRDTLRSANRLELVSSLLIIMMIPFMVRNNLQYMKHYDGIYDMLLDGSALLAVSVALLAIFWLVMAVFGILRSVRLRQRYLLDRSYHPDPEVRKRKRIRIVLLALWGMSALILVVVIFTSSGKLQDVPLSDCPVVLLESLCPEEAAQLDYDNEYGDAPFGIAGKYLLYSFATYRQDGPTIWPEGEGVGRGYIPFSYWVNVMDIRSESLAEKYYAEKVAAHDDWQEVQINGWDQAMYRRYTTNLRQEFRSDQLPETPDWQQQILLLRLGSRVVTIGYDGEADMYPRLNTLYGRRYTSSASAAAT